MTDIKTTIYISDYNEKRNPATYKFIGFGSPEYILDYTIEKLVPIMRVGMDAYLKNDFGIWAFHRDLKKYPKSKILKILKNEE